MAWNHLIAFLLFCIKFTSGKLWVIHIDIDGRQFAESKNNLYLDVNGSEQDKTGVLLGDKFLKNEQRKIEVDANFGKIKSIRIYQFGKDGVLVQKVSLSDGSRHFIFTCDCWIQTDGQSSWTLYTKVSPGSTSTQSTSHVDPGSRTTIHTDPSTRRTTHADPGTCGTCCNVIRSQEQLVTLMSHLKAELTISKNNTSAYRRKRISVYESRPSSVAMGSLGCLVIALVLGLIVVPDAFYLVIFLRKTYRRHSKAKTCSYL